MTAEKLLDRLDRVKRTGEGRWLARCPAHDDGRPSLAVRALEDGRVLVRCFAGCGFDAVVAAVGLEPSDLFPERLETPRERRERRAFFHARDVLRALAAEIAVVDAAAGTVQRRGYLRDDECARLALARERIAGGLAYAGYD